MAAAEPARQLRPDERRARERRIVDAARELFDERGLQDAPMDEIAKLVGINRALIYRHFESKEELFVLTVTRYLTEITERANAVVDRAASPERQLRQAWGSFATYCLEHPAFLDCALSLMRRPARELRERVSEATWLRLGISMASCLEITTQILEIGKAGGDFTIDDPKLTANALYTQTLGLMHMARIGVTVSESAPGVPNVSPIAAEQVHATCIRHALAAVGILDAPSPGAV